MLPKEFPRRYEFEIPAENSDGVLDSLADYSDSAQWRGASTDPDATFPNDGSFTLEVAYDGDGDLPPAPTVKPFMLKKYVVPVLRENSGDAETADTLDEFVGSLREHGDAQSPSPNDTPMPFYLYVDAPSGPSGGRR